MDEKEESTSSGNVILKLPLAHLKFLRSDFESEDDGLDLDQFLLAMVEHTKFETVEEILNIIPSMIDFFKDVDINGDGHMDWQEFTQSIISRIEKVVLVHNENIHLISDVMIQKPPAHNSCNCCKIVPELKRAFICILDEIIMYGLNEQSSNLLTPILKKFKLKPLDPTERYNLTNENNNTNNNIITATITNTTTNTTNTTINNNKNLEIDERIKKGNNNDNNINNKIDTKVLTVPYVLQINFISSLSVLCILRSDNSVEFLRMIVRVSSSSMSEAIEHLGIIMLGNAFTSFAIRDIPKIPILFFAVGADSNTYYWNLINKGNHIVLSTTPHILNKHHDYVLDILTISTDSYKLLISCGMDKKVRMWDLSSMHYKTVRSYVSGLIHLAFDSKSIIIAAACDCNVIGWDLDSQMDLPLFKLSGHLYPVHKIVGLGNVNRCLTLDSEGILQYWDIMKSGIDDDERLIKELHTASIDKLSTFDCFQNVSSRYKGTVILAQGKQQHVYCMQDSTPNESPPFTSLFATELLMIISVHTKNIIQWNVLNGQQIKSHSYVPSIPNCELTCAVLADRNRKLITGDSYGNIILYSCLSIQLLRRFAQYPYAIKHLIFSPDRNVICIGNPGYLHILDSSLNNLPDNSIEYNLRDVHAHSVDVICMIFSRILNLIATGDSDGIIKIWSYTTLMIDTLIDVKDITINGDFSQMIFLDPYPLLLIPDIDSSFYIIAVGYASLKFGKKLWKINTSCHLPTTTTTLSSLPTVRSEIDITKRKYAVDKQNDRDVLHIIEKYNKKLVYLSAKRSTTFLFMRQPLKTIVTTPIINSFAPKANYILENNNNNNNNNNNILSINSKSIDEQDDYDEYSIIKHIGTISSLPSSLNNFVEDRDILIYVGNDDGTVAVINFTSVLAEIDIRVLEESEYFYNTRLYNCKTRLQRKIRPELVERASWSSQDIERVRISTRRKALLEYHWSGHINSIVSISLIGDKNYVMTASDDSSIQVNSLEGELISILTRGRTIDGILKTQWISPIDINARNERRKTEALEFMEKNVDTVHPLTRATYLTKQMEKNPELFDLDYTKNILLSTDVFDENNINNSTINNNNNNNEIINKNSLYLTKSTITNNQRHINHNVSIDTFQTFSTFYNDSDSIRKFCLTQAISDIKELNDDNKINELNNEIKKKKVEDDSDLESLVSSARGPLNKTMYLKRNEMIEKREKRFYDSVTLDANKLIENIANESILNKSNTPLDFPVGISSASIIEHQRQLEHNKLKHEAAKQASFRQKALYPQMFSEKLQRQKSKELTTKTLHSNRNTTINNNNNNNNTLNKLNMNDTNITKEIEKLNDDKLIQSNRIPPLNIEKTEKLLKKSNNEDNRNSNRINNIESIDNISLHPQSPTNSHVNNNSNNTSPINFNNNLSKIRDNLYNSNIINNSRSTLLLTRLSQTSSIGNIGLEHNLKTLQQKLEIFDRKLMSIDNNNNKLNYNTVNTELLEQLDEQYSISSLHSYNSSDDNSCRSILPSEVIEASKTNNNSKRRYNIKPIKGNPNNINDNIIEKSNSINSPSLYELRESKWVTKVKELLETDAYSPSSQKEKMKHNLQSLIIDDTGIPRVDTEGPLVNLNDSVLIAKSRDRNHLKLKKESKLNENKFNNNK